MSDDHGERRPTHVRRALLVDDHELLVKSLARDFDRNGIEVWRAANMADALALAAEHEPDLAIIDLFLAVPDNGIELVKALKARPNPPFCILISAHMSVAHAVMAVRAGADDVLVKPVSARQVLNRIASGEPSAEARLAEKATPTLQQIEWEHIARVLDDYDGNITHAAEALGVFRQSLQRKIQKHAPRALTPPDVTAPPRRSRRRKTDAPK